MAETLYGRHRRMDCRDCGFRFAWQAARGGARSRITCPNCGCEQTPPDAESEIPGDHVLVARSMPALRAPKRWEPVVVRRPGRESELVVKRLVGLPGETVELRHGDLYIDGRLERKTLRQQRATAVLVHDAHWMPSSLPEEERPWQEAHGRRRWTWREGCFIHSKVERLAPPAAAAPWPDWPIRPKRGDRRLAHFRAPPPERRLRRRLPRAGDQPARLQPGLPSTV